MKIPHKIVDNSLTVGYNVHNSITKQEVNRQKMAKLKAIREQSGLKAKDVAAKLGVTRSTLWHYEKGKRKPTFEMMVKLAQLYGVSVADFVDEG